MLHDSNESLVANPLLSFFPLALKNPKEGFAALNPAPGPFAVCQQSIRLGHLVYKGQGCRRKLCTTSETSQ